MNSLISNLEAKKILSQIKTTLPEIDDDLKNVENWLARYTGHTKQNYKREMERFLLWCFVENKKTISLLKYEDITSYLNFIDNMNTSSWAGERKRKNDENWKPFAGELSQNSKKNLIRVINACLNFLVKSGYIKLNPMSLLIKKNLNDDIHIKHERFLDENSWHYLQKYIEALPTDTPKKTREKARTSIIFSMLYHSALRLSELTKAKMSDIIFRRDSWWLKVIGKGKKEAILPISPHLLDDLKKYRVFLGLEEYPAPSEHSPIIRNLNGTKAISSNQIYRLIKKTFLEASLYIKHENIEASYTLQQASTHWIRHTSLTHLAEAGVDIKYLKSFARHEDISTTQRYLHSEEDELHSIISKVQGKK